VNNADSDLPSNAAGITCLLTEFKNPNAYDAREKLFASICKQLPNNVSGVVKPPQQEDLYETVSTRVFQDYSNTDNARFQLLAKD